MPPASLISSMRIFMPFTAGFENGTAGPDMSCAVPSTISVFVTPCTCACASDAPSASATANTSFFIVSLLRVFEAALLYDSLRQPRPGRERLRPHRVVVLRLQRLRRMACGQLAHERRIDRVTEHALQPRRHLCRDFGRDAEHEVLLLARPWLAILIGEREARPRASIRTAAMHQRAGKDDAGTRRHLQRNRLWARQLLSPIRSPAVTSRNHFGRAVFQREVVDRRDRRERDHRTRAWNRVEAVVEVKGLRLLSGIDADR